MAAGGLGIESLTTEMLSHVMQYIQHPSEKMLHRTVNSQFCAAIDMCNAWQNVYEAQIVWDGFGGNVMVNFSRSNNMERDRFFDFLDYLLPKMACLQSLDIRSNVQQGDEGRLQFLHDWSNHLVKQPNEEKSETFVQWLHEQWLPSDDFWQLLMDHVECCPLSRLRQVRLDVGKLGIPADITYVSRAINRFRHSLESLELMIVWSQFGGLDNWRAMLAGIEHTTGLHHLRLFISKQWKEEEDTDANSIYEALQHVLHNKHITELAIKTEFTPDYTCVTSLLNSLAQACLRSFSLHIPHGEYDYLQFWNKVSAPVVSQLEECEFNVRIVEGLTGEWLQRLPALMPRLKSIRTDYVIHAPLDATELREIVSEWFWSLGENEPSVYWWPVSKAVDLRFALQPLQDMMKIVMSEEIGTHLVWVNVRSIIPGDGRRLSLCVKRV